MTNLSSGAHILVFPYPAPGHMMPLLDLTHQLALRGLTITILVTPKNLPILQPLLSTHTNIRPLVLPFPAHPSLPSGAENVKDLPPSAFPAIMRAMRQLHTPILNWFQTHASPPVAIISDMFLWWTHHLACQLSIRRYMFSPSGVMAMAIIYSLRRYPPERNDPSDPNGLISLSKIPNSPIYPWWQLQFLYSTSYVEGDPISEFMRDGVMANMASWGLVFNSFTELERVYLDHVMAEAAHDRVWAVGPLLPTEDDQTAPTCGPSSESKGDIVSWLDTCGDNTVVYVCFGSQAMLSDDQMEQIASGLEKSGARFLWCVKEASGYGVVPPGFEERTVGRGLVLKDWAPQVTILRHRAVGAFLTHCGWNSVLEGLMAGVPMLAWPMEGDQFLNATLVVDELKVATLVCEGAQTVPDPNKFAQFVSEAVGKGVTRNVRTRALRVAGLEAMREGGSSQKDLDRLALDIAQGVSSEYDDGHEK
ncbi:UDP-glycosyltransferase 89B2-like isoform X3 [Actinidia eriantha]|uniref:UDP-glycosyltransferase 89B2-like isoform X2 n=1 Tax=Actinidia eriantha TaxID=165200 RepID=UPI00258F3047|nr:UDP-glycosyltransferase 89B2-like isoform X2 [Actinidia eriantha]XP_057479654.1 UDP-glycosyltransferase 89B2-like isoform X3 [Actinidia eriantha]